MQEHPTHVVCAWIGNSAAVAQKHYLQVTDEDFDRAVGVVQNQAQQASERVGNGRKSKPMEGTKIPNFPEFSGKNAMSGMGTEGFEQTQNPSRKSGSPPSGSALYSALPPDLAQVATAWPELSEATKRAISAIVEADAARRATIPEGTGS